MSTDIVDAELVLTERQAKDITARIRQWVNDFPVDDIKAAFTGRIWLTMNYGSWAEYLDAEFDFAGRLRLPALERVEAVAALSESGMSEVAVAETLGISRNTVRKDKATQPVHFEQVEQKVIGKDGRTRGKPKKNNVVPLFKDAAEQRDITDMSVITDEQFEEVLAEGRAEGDLSRENVASKAREVVELPAGVVTDDDWQDGIRFVVASHLKDPVIGNVLVGGYQRLDGYIDWWIDINGRDLNEPSPDLIRNAARALMEAADELERRQAQ